MTPTPIIETGKKLNTNWPEKKKETAKVKIESMKSKQNNKEKIYEAKNFIIWEYQ